MERVKDVQGWFAKHVTLDGKPYTLDYDQARAVSDLHKNTLVTARAGSGKTRVIVAKVAYLVARCDLSLDEIAVFMFNRTAATEVNQRIAAVKVDGWVLPAISPNRATEVEKHTPKIEKHALKAGKHTPGIVKVASTFHKYALDLVKLAGEHPEIISEFEQEEIIQSALVDGLAECKYKASRREFLELLGIVKGFIARAGQKFPGEKMIQALKVAVGESCTDLECMNESDAGDVDRKIFYHRLSLATYQIYLQRLQRPKIDFNLLMARATELLGKAKISSELDEAYASVRALRYLMIDEYQDFSYLFFALTQAIRALAPTARLFAVGDDWQAINRFAGSDVDYFINFASYFSEDTINIPLATNYRSDRRIVEYANKYMLNNYNSKALPAISNSRHAGKIKIINPNRTKFDQKDIDEDGLGDARFQRVLQNAVGEVHLTIDAYKLLKRLYIICKKHRHEQIMLLHRHNFTSFRGLGLENLMTALGNILSDERIMSEDAFREQVRCMTMHKSKGLEADVVILLEVDREIVQSHHPHATIFPVFSDTLAAERADQQRLMYVALTRAKHRLYILSTDQTPPVY